MPGVSTPTVRTIESIAPKPMKDPSANARMAWRRGPDSRNASACSTKERTISRGRRRMSPRSSAGLPQFGHAAPRYGSLQSSQIASATAMPPSRRRDHEAESGAFSRWPPNSRRIAESIRSAKSASPRELKRA